MAKQDERKPIYAGNNRYRIVSRPNGLWRAEYRAGDQPGRKRTDSTPHFDPWEPLSHDLNKEAALGFLPKS